MSPCFGNSTNNRAISVVWLRGVKEVKKSTGGVHFRIVGTIAFSCRDTLWGFNPMQPVIPQRSYYGKRARVLQQTAHGGPSLVNTVDEKEHLEIRPSRHSLDLQNLVLAGQMVDVSMGLNPNLYFDKENFVYTRFTTVCFGESFDLLVTSLGVADDSTEAIPSAWL
ncbi:hypothetical protein FF38_09692 [Lucilia cuprina]|uniref:Uncharacterized protein n=1 Tax=Lucilia cuprina TaxID=7375 RepID=A0A0L0C538_LUCCU|nr:hypothetical protein FF38_09692 [Lucilia cuprina]